MKLGSSINGVILILSPDCRDREVKAQLVHFLMQLITTEIQDFMNPNKIYKIISLGISSTSEPYHEHKIGGPHRGGLAIDIAAVNGKSITHLYNHDEELTGICDALQLNATDIKNVFESFGPLMCFKMDRDGNSRQIKKDTKVINQHKSHLHFSVRP